MNNLLLSFLIQYDTYLEIAGQIKIETKPEFFSNFELSGAVISERKAGEDPGII